MNDAKWILHTAVDDLGSGLIDFIPMVSKAWRSFYNAKISVCIISGDDSAAQKELYTEKYGEFVDYLGVVGSVPSFKRASVAKLARLWSACLLPDVLPVMIDDIDWVPLQDSFFATKFQSWEPGRVLRVGQDAYADSWREAGKAPMSTMTAHSSLWLDILNPDALPFAQYCQSECDWQSIDCEGRDNPHHPTNFSDESLMRRSLLRWGKTDRIIDVKREYHTFNDTIDRSRWDLMNVDKLNDGQYIGAHMLRPYNENLEHCACAESCGWRSGLLGLRPIIDYIDRCYERWSA